MDFKSENTTFKTNFDSVTFIKGDPGYTPQKGIDYWTEEDKKEITEYIDEQTEIIKSDIEGIQEDIKNEAHFKGYLSTNAKIQALEATPNDFAYSAESGTKWIYDSENGWQDTGVPVPDQLTPASELTPLIDGEASAGESETYARGDHRHPTDTTRASVEDLNNALERISFEKTVSGNATTQVTISDFAIAPIKIKTVNPNESVTIIPTLESGFPAITTICTDLNGEYELIPDGTETKIEFSCVCDFAVTYQVDLSKIIDQVDQNTEDIASLSKLSEDFETALDKAIALCDTYINSVGGVAE